MDRALDDPRGVPPKIRRELSPQARADLRRILGFLLVLRDQQGHLTRVQLRELHRLLVEGADSLYRLADRVERDARARAPRGLFLDLVDQVERVGPADDPVLATVHDAICDLRRQHRERLRARRLTWPRDLRAAAIQLLNLAGDVEHARTVPSARRRAPIVGRPRNQILDQILEYADRRSVRDVDLARALADVQFVPDGPGSIESDLAERWAAIIKSARARRRKVG